MSAWVEGVAVFVAGGVAVETGHYYLPRLFNRLTPPAALDVVVVPDPLDYLIGDPDWTYFGFVVSETPADIGAPPERPCRNWWRWGRDLGAADANRTEFELVIVGRQDTSVVVQGLEVKVALRDEPGGRQVLACPVGGAEGSPRHIRVNLDWPEGMTSFVAPGGEGETSDLFLHVAKGHVEKLRVRAETSSSYVEWTGNLVVIVNGAVQRVPIDCAGKSFRTCAANELPHWTWQDGDWKRSGLFGA